MERAESIKRTPSRSSETGECTILMRDGDNARRSAAVPYAACAYLTGAYVPSCRRLVDRTGVPLDMPSCCRPGGTRADVAFLIAGTGRERTGSS
jgi:hypothetical protein